MSIQMRNFPEGQNAKITAQFGGYSVLEYERDLSVSPQEAQLSYFASKMNVGRRQLVCDLDRFASHSVTMQADAMQWTAGDVQPLTGIRGVGDTGRFMFTPAAQGQVADAS